MNIQSQIENELKPLEVAASDYAMVRDTIEFLSDHWHTHPDLETIAGETGHDPFTLQKTFTRWAGISPKSFVQAITLDHARSLLRNASSVLDATYEVGLSAPSRLHDLFVTHEAMSPGVYKAKGAGVTIFWDFVPSPFGQALLMVTEHGLAGAAFADEGEENGALEDMVSRWPNALYQCSPEKVAPVAVRIFNPSQWQADQPLKVVFIGTDFEVRVWETLLKIPIGEATTYGDIAEHLGKPKGAARAVGTAVGKNPISFVVPCHRVLGKSGNLCGYHWGLTRKKAMLGWESGL